MWGGPKAELGVLLWAGPPGFMAGRVRRHRRLPWGSGAEAFLAIPVVVSGASSRARFRPCPRWGRDQGAGKIVDFHLGGQTISTGAAVGIGAALLGWALVGMLYMYGLRAVLGARERSLQRGIDEVAAGLRLWQADLSEVSQREWRESAAAMEQVIDGLASGGRLRERVATLAEVRLILEARKPLLSRAGEPAGPRAHERVARIENALSRVEGEMARYNAAAVDAAFACERVPLSLLAAAVGLQARPVLSRRRSGKPSVY